MEDEIRNCPNPECGSEYCISTVKRHSEFKDDLLRIMCTECGVCGPAVFLEGYIDFDEVEYDLAESEAVKMWNRFCDGRRNKV